MQETLSSVIWSVPTLAAVAETVAGTAVEIAAGTAVEIVAGGVVGTAAGTVVEIAAAAQPLVGLHAATVVAGAPTARKRAAAFLNAELPSVAELAR